MHSRNVKEISRLTKNGFCAYIKTEHSIKIQEETMSVAREQIQDFQEKSLILSIGGITGILTGGFIGLIIGTYIAAKYNAATILDSGVILGLSISIALSLIWMVIVAVWTRKVSDIGVWVRLIATNMIFFGFMTWLGYFLGATVGAVGTAVLSRIL